MSPNTSAFLFAIALVLCVPGAAANGTPCQKSANKQLHSCWNTKQGEYHNQAARCKLLPTRTDRMSCREELKERRWEDRGLCKDRLDARIDVCATLGEFRHEDPLLDPSLTFIHPDDVPAVYAPNPYVSVESGRTLLLRAGDEFEEVIVIHVSGDTRNILGVECRVVWDVAFEFELDDGEIEYDPVELTQDWFAQSDTGDVVYCGEAVQDFEDGIVFTIAGSFEAGKDQSMAGFLTKAQPVVGDVHRQEIDLGDAEDVVEYLALNAVPTPEEGGENPFHACDPEGCLKTFDYSPLEPESTEIKYYKPGIGFVLAVAMEDGEVTGEREELVCAGDSLEVLTDPSCELDDPDALLDMLCELVPDALCLEE